MGLPKGPHLVTSDRRRSGSKVTRLIEALRSLGGTFSKAESAWEDLSVDFELANVIFDGSKRRVYLPDGAKYLPYKDDQIRVKGWTTPRKVALMVERGMLDPDAEIAMIPRHAPILETVVSKRTELSKNQLKESIWIG